MIALCMDTSHIFLALSLIKDDQVIGRVQKLCWKKQSEEIFPELIAMMDENGLTPDMIDAVVISEGPGSYTGVRIAMTVAKVFCSMKEVPLYTIGTLQLYAGNNTCRVMTDARGKRVYTAVFENGRPVSAPEAVYIADLPESVQSENIIGDGHLIGREDMWPDIAENFLALKEQWKKAENVHTVVPEYLKPSEAYLTGK